MKHLRYALPILCLLTANALGANDLKFKQIHVADLAKMLSDSSQKVALFDANNAKTRKEFGVIPGAKLLPSYDKYDTASTLPADKATTLVFYCANTQCGASHTAADKASDAGYQHVDVMVDGIAGWKSAGQKTMKP